MPLHPLVRQLHFARLELQRCLEGVTGEDARKRLGAMNCISWMVGHLADQENRYWVQVAQGINIHPQLNGLVGFGKPASTPDLEEMWQAWSEITRTADQYLTTLDAGLLTTHFVRDRKPMASSIGSMLLRNLYHYWFHIGEAHAVRQMLGHRDLPQFVGNMADFSYQPESDQ
jgi:hypothetical protein